MKYFGIFERLKKTGFFNIVVSGMLNRAIQFLSGVILVRVLSTTEYGAYSYALNIVNYFVLINGLGMSSSIVQFCVEQKTEDGAERMYRTASSIGMIWDLALFIVILIVAAFVHLPVAGSNVLLFFLAPFPLFSFAVESQQQRLRSLFRNSQYAFATNLNTVLLVILSVVGAIIGSSVGLSIGRTLSMFVTVIVVSLVFHVRVYLTKICERREVIIDMLKLSLTVCSASTVTQILMLCGTTIIGYLLGDEKAVAIYTSASTIPFALAFLPQMIVTYASPYFIRHAHDRKWILHHWIMCLSGAFAVCLAIGLFFISTASWLIPFVFGPQYAESVPSFVVLMIGFIVGQPLRVVSMSVLGSHRKNVANLVSGLIMLAINMVLSIALIPRIGVVASAIGYTISMIVGAVLSCAGVFYYAGRPNDAVREREFE